MAEPIKMPFGTVSGVDPRNRVCWHRLANTVERLFSADMSVSATRDGDAACFQIRLLWAILFLRGGRG